MIKEAMLYEKLSEGRVRCVLCAHRCTVEPGKRGMCGVRENKEGVLYSLVYGTLIAENIDPIEKNLSFMCVPLPDHIPLPRWDVILVVIFVRITTFHKCRVPRA